MPSKNGVRRHDRCHVRQQPTAETAADDRETPPVVVSEPQTLIAQLGFQDAVLFGQVQNDFVLLTLEPAEEGRDEELQRSHSVESTLTAGNVFVQYGSPCRRYASLRYRELAACTGSVEVTAVSSTSPSDDGGTLVRHTRLA